MGLSCSWDGDTSGCDWWWESNLQYYPLNTKRSRKCCSCGEKINVGDDSIIIHRARVPNSRIEERICGDEVSITTWYLCEDCGGLAISLDELGFSFTLGGQSIKEQIAEYRRQEKDCKQ